jgi:YD repeat-containing protein
MLSARQLTKIIFVTCWLTFIGPSRSLPQITNVTADQAPPIPGVGHEYIKMLNETVNPATGSVSIRISLPVPASRGFSIPFAFGYDSNSEHHRSGPSTFWDNSSYLGEGGWSYVVPTLSFNPHTIQYVPISGGSAYTCTFVNDHVFQDPNGTTHNLYLAVFQPNNTGNCVYPSNSTPTNYLSGGDPWVQAVTTGTYTVEPPVTVADQSGTVYYFANSANVHAVNGVMSSLPTWIEDRNGNKITVTDSGNGNFVIPDTAGRNAISSSGFGATGNTVTVSGLSPYVVTWGTSQINWPYSENIANDAGSNTCGTLGLNNYTLSGMPLGEITQIQLPNGQSYQFQYSDTVSGLLTKIIYPTGGYIRYVWGTNSLSDSIDFYADRNGSFTCHQIYDTQALTDRYVSFDGTTEPLHQHFTYTTNWVSDPQVSTAYQYWSSKITTVTTYVSGTSFTTSYTYLPYDIAPNPYDSAYEVKNYELQWAPVYVEHPIPVESTIWQNNTNATALLLTTKGWLNQYQVNCELTELNDGSISGQVYSYGSGGILTDKKEYDYGQFTTTGACQNGSVTLPSSPPARETVITPASFAATPIYPSAPSIFGRPASVVTYGSGVKAAETDYAFDQTAVSSVNNVSTQTHDETNYGPSYNNRGNATSKTAQCLQVCTSAVTKYTYDETGQTLTKLDPCGNATCSDMTGASHTTSYSYTDNYDSNPGSNTNAYLTKITNPLNQSWTFKYAYADGQLIQSTDPNSLITGYSYGTEPSGCSFPDELRRLTEVADPDGGQTTYCYNDTPPTPSVTVSKTINSTTTLTTMSVKDGAGHETESEVTSDPQGTIFTDTTYDGLGRVSTVSNPHRTCGTDPTSTCGITTYAYDPLNRKISVTYPDSSVLQTAYCGPSTLVTDPSKRWRRSRSDALGRVVEVDEPNAIGAQVNTNGCPSTGDPTWVTNYSYDAFDKLTFTIQSGSRGRYFTYDSLGRLVCASNPENSSAGCPTVASNYLVGTVGYAYDANSNLTSKTDARSITTSYTYDVINRELTRTYSNNDPTVTTSYDQSNCLGLSSCQNIGHRTSMTDAAGSEAWAYDVQQSSSQTVEVDQRTTANVTKTTTSALNLAGNIFQLTYPTGRVVNYTYDGANRPRTAYDGSNGITYTTGWQTGLPSGCVSSAVCYTPQGTPYAVSIGQTSSFSGLNLTHIYNSRLQPGEFKASSTGGSAMDISYSYVDPSAGGNAGHVFSITNNLNASRSQSFTYDQVNRILSAGTSATTGNGCWGYQYTYDIWGSLTSQAGWAPTYNACVEWPMNLVTADYYNQLVWYPPGQLFSALTYDASGNTLSDGQFGYTWNAESQLTHVGALGYLYDGDGRRVAKVNSKLYWYGANDEVLAETDTSGNVVNEYIFFGGRRIALIAWSNQ